MNDDSDFLYKESCPECGSRDNLARYSDGHGYCFGCQHYEPAGDSVTEQPTTRVFETKDLIDEGTPQALTSRGLSLETCAHWGLSLIHISEPTRRS